MNTISIGRGIVFVAVALLTTHVFAQQGSVNGRPFQDLQAQIDSLQNQIDNLSTGNSHQGPYAVTVDCDNGESINAAIQAAPSSASNVRINVLGHCTEQVRANRANLSLSAAAPGASITSTNGAAVWNDSHERMGIIGLHLSSQTGPVVVCSSGSMGIHNANIDATGIPNGINMTAGCAATIRNTQVNGGDFALNINNNAVVGLWGVTVQNTLNQAMIVLNGAVVSLNGGASGPTTFADNYAGITVGGNATLLVHDAVVSNNQDHGIRVGEGSYIRVTDGANLVANNNGSFGLVLTTNSTAAFWLDPAVEITGNGNEDISCDDSIRVGGNLTFEPRVVVGTISSNCPSNL